MQLTGRVFFTVGGKRLGSKEGGTINVGGLERTGVTGDTGVLGYQEKETIPFMECTIAHNKDVSLMELLALKDTTVIADTDTGKSYTLRNAWTAKAHEIAKGGDVALRFEGMKCEEV